MVKDLLVDGAGIQEAFDEVFDQAIVFHGFADYMRDYDVFVATWSLLDCRHPQGQMWWWEMGDRDKLTLTLPQWLAAWLDGRIDEVRDNRGLMLAEESWHPSSG